MHKTKKQSKKELFLVSKVCRLERCCSKNSKNLLL